MKCGWKKIITTKSRANAWHPQTLTNIYTAQRRVATLLIIGLSSSLSIGSEVLCTQLFVHRWRSRTKVDLQRNCVNQQHSNNPRQILSLRCTTHLKALYDTHYDFYCFEATES